LDLTSLDATVQELFSAGLAPSTQKSYRSGSKRFIGFCERFRIAKPFPVSEQVLVYFVALLYRDGLSSGTIKSYLAAVRHSQIALGLGDPHVGDMPQLEYVSKGVKKMTACRSARPRLPITPSILRQLRQFWQTLPNRHDALMLWAAACMCFFGFLRAGEVVIPSASGYDSSVHLSQGDVRVDNTARPQYLEVRIKASKTDPFRKGVSVYLGKGCEDLCPVTAILNYMVQRGSVAGPFFQFSNGNVLTRERFVTAVRSALAATGFNSSHYAGHSFRIGAATTAAQRGIQDSLIKTLGRWESSAYTVYIRTPRETLCSVARSLARSN